MPTCASGVSPSEAHDPELPVEASLNPFLLDLPCLPNPLLGAALVQGKHCSSLVLVRLETTCTVHLRVGFGRAAGKTEGLDTTCPRTGSCTSSGTSLLVLQQERR